MKKRILCLVLIFTMLFAMLPVAIKASETENVYISISYDGQFIGDKNGEAIAYIAVPLADLSAINLDEYGLSDYNYDADGDGNYEITALHLYIYSHETLIGLDWSSVRVSGGVGSIFFEAGLFGFEDCNLNYYHNGIYPEINGWGITADQIVLRAGDFFDIAGYSDWSFWMDSAAGFHYFLDENGEFTHNYRVEENEELKIQFVRSYSAMGYGESVFPEGYYNIYYGTSIGDASGTITTEDDGSATITFPSAGTWYIWCDGGYGAEFSYAIVSSPTSAIVDVIATNIEEDNSEGDNSEGDNSEGDNSEENNPVENEIVLVVENMITEIKGFSIHDVDSFIKVKDARAAYNALSEEQQGLVKNIEDLIYAEKIIYNASNADFESVYKLTANYLENLGTPSVGSTGGEWMVIDLTRAGYVCPNGYYENVLAYVKENINDKEQLHRAKSTDNSRVILALTSAGYDVTNVEGHNLLMGLTDMTYLKKQGINGPIWALIALDSYNYEIPVNKNATEQATRENIIAYILNKQLEDGGWALSGKKADPDMTGMAIQSLAPYYETNLEVKAAIDNALICLSNIQLANGGYGSMDGACSESCAQVVVALTTLGIDPETDSRFIKNGISVLDAMCLFAVEGGGFAHIPNGALNGMATEQAQYALVSYYRLKDGKTPLYNMTDVSIKKVEMNNPEKNDPEMEIVDDEIETPEITIPDTGDMTDITGYLMLMGVAGFCILKGLSKKGI